MNNKKRKILSITMCIVMLLGTNILGSDELYDNVNFIGITNKVLEKDDFESNERYNNYLKSLSTEQQIMPLAMEDLKPTTTVTSDITYTFDYSNADCDNAIQNFCFDSNGLIYVTQNASKDDGYDGTAVKGDVIISECKLNGNVIEFKSSMILKNGGHGQTLESYTYTDSNNVSKKYLLVSTESKKSGDNYWSIQIGRLEYKANKTVDSSEVNKLTYLSYANSDLESLGSVKRCDAAISANNKYLLIWSKIIDKNNENSEPIQYSCYDFETINKQLDKSSTVSFKANTTLKKVLEYSFTQKGNQKIFPQGSVQGIEVTNNANMYISSGKESDSPWICNVSKSGKWKSTVKVAFSDWGSSFEMEGIKIKGEYLYFASKASAKKCRIGRIKKEVLD